MGIIVVGVLIAPAAEELVERVGEHHRADQAWQQIKDELNADQGPVASAP